MIFSDNKPLQWVLVFLPLILGVATSHAERVYLAGYKGGFYIQSEEEGGMELRLGGAFQTDYRCFAEEARADNRFDIRKARLIFRGGLTQWFKFGMEFEFQGNETNNLVDAYGEALFGGTHALRFGQFKEPFSLEWQTSDKAQWFAERSMGYDLGPKRDLGIMLHGSFFSESVHYAAGLFNGDGDDGSTRGNQHDAPEATGRLVVAPLKHVGPAWLKNLQVGGSASYANVDLTNIDLKIKTTGMVGTNRNIYVLNANTKFGVLYDVDNRLRGGLEAAWTWGSGALAGEMIYLRYTDLLPTGDTLRDADFSTWYVAGLWCLSGEKPILRNGAFMAVRPDRFFNPGENTWGAVYLSVRMDRFYGDKDWINPTAFVSVREAEAYSMALTWSLFPMHRFLLDYTHTELSDPIRVRVLPDGSVDYIEEENVITLRYCLDF